MLAPFDLQAVKACGVTFAQSIIERVIEEMAKGDASQADAIRARCIDILGSSLTSVKAGSEEAEGVKQALIEAGMWSQYLEVGIGPTPRCSPRHSRCPLSAGGGCRAAPRVRMEQPGAGDRAGGEQPRRDQGREPWQ